MLCKLANKWENFWFSIVKKLLYFAQENLLDTLGGHGIGINIHGCQHNPRNDHLLSKTSSKTIAIVWHVDCRVM